MSWTNYLINLAENTQRLENSKREFAEQGLSFERIDGVNGWELSDAEIGASYDREKNKKKAKTPLIPAEIGCYLSHRKVWELIAAGQAEGGFIFEDDFTAAPDLSRILNALEEDRVDDWDMVKLFAFNQKLKALASRELCTGVRIVQPHRIPTCLIGYGLTRAAAQKLVAAPVKIFRPVDENQKFFWETGLRVSAILPSPIEVGDQSAATGTIGKARRKAGKERGSLNLAKIWRGISYQAHYNLMLAYHRRFKR